MKTTVIKEIPDPCPITGINCFTKRIASSADIYIDRGCPVLADDKNCDYVIREDK